MSFERADPIPPGYYWLDLLRETDGKTRDMIDNFSLWVRSFSPPAVRVLKTEGAWVLFEVMTPAMRWGVEDGLGFPTRAPWGASTTMTMTGLVDRRDPEGISEYWIRKGIESLSKAATEAKETGLSDKLWNTSGLGWALALFAASKFFGKR